MITTASDPERCIATEKRVAAGHLARALGLPTAEPDAVVVLRLTDALRNRWGIVAAPRDLGDRSVVKLGELRTIQIISLGGTGDLLDDLRLVGPRKPMGYLPLDAILRRTSLEDLRAELEERDLATLEIPAGGEWIRAGALFAYDVDALRVHLDRHRSVVERHGWPTSPGEFVAEVAATIADPDEAPDLYRVVGLAFADPRF